MYTEKGYRQKDILFFTNSTSAINQIKGDKGHSLNQFYTKFVRIFHHSLQFHISFIWIPSLPQIVYHRQAQVLAKSREERDTRVVVTSKTHDFISSSISKSMDLACAERFIHHPKLENHPAKGRLPETWLPNSKASRWLKIGLPVRLSSFLFQAISGHGRFGSYKRHMNIQDEDFPQFCNCTQLGEETSPDHFLSCQLSKRVRSECFTSCKRDAFHCLSWPEVLVAEGSVIYHFLEKSRKTLSSMQCFVRTPFCF